MATLPQMKMVNRLIERGYMIIPPTDNKIGGPVRLKKGNNVLKVLSSGKLERDKKMNPTYEQLASAVRVNNADDGLSTFWSSYNPETKNHDREVPILCVNVNDLWEWALADCEQIRWDHILIFEEGYNQFNNNELKEELFRVAYAAVIRGSEPKNYFEHFKMVPPRHEGNTGFYRPINEDELKVWEEMKSWWKERLEKCTEEIS